MGDPIADTTAALIAHARQHALTKWGPDSVAAMAGDHWDYGCLAILVEEVGEVAHAINEGDTSNLAEELAQVAAVATLWLEGMVARGDA
jgi:phosphoribosyl-ATP pyrophosphohydrolase